MFPSAFPFPPSMNAFCEASSSEMRLAADSSLCVCKRMELNCDMKRHIESEATKSLEAKVRPRSGKYAVQRCGDRSRYWSIRSPEIVAFTEMYSKD